MSTAHSVLKFVFNINDLLVVNLFSIYFSSDDITSLGISTATVTSYFLGIGPNPTILSGVDLVSIGMQASLTSSGLLDTAILNRAHQIEHTWELLLVDNVAGSDRLGTEFGEPYFVNVIPNLRLMEGVSALFFNLARPVDVDEKTHVLTYEQSLRETLQNGGANSQYWDNAVDNFANQFGMSGDVLWTIVAIALSMLMAGGVFHFSGGNITIGLLAFAFTLPTLALLGIGNLTTVAIMTFVAAIGLGWVLFLKGA